MHILVLGAGGIGGYFGGRLVQAGAAVTFLVRERRRQQLEADGLIVQSPLGGVQARVRAVLRAEDAAPADIVLLACKAYDLDAALNSIPGALMPGTVILPLLNGVAHLGVIAERFPAVDLWGGIAHIGVTLTSDGGVRHLNDLNNLIFGPRTGGADARANAFQSLFAHTPVDARAHDNIVQPLWDKLVFLTTLAGMTCLMRANVGTILAVDGGERLILQLLDECEQIAAAEGFCPEPRQIAQYREQLTQRGSASTASMLRDIERGGPTEAEHILGDMTMRAKRHGVSAPLLAIALTHLRAHETLRAKSERPHTAMEMHHHQVQRA